MTNPDGIASAASAATALVAGAPPVNTVRPAIIGTVQRASTLTAGEGAWIGTGNTYAYQWQRGATNIPDATGPTYTLTVADVGATIRVVVIATNPDGVVAAASTSTITVPSARPVNTVRPAISGSARRGSTLTGTAGTWSGIGNTYAYQWQRDGVNISGATSLTYTLGVADVGAVVRLLVTADNPEGSAEPGQLRDRHGGRRCARQLGAPGHHRDRAARRHADRGAWHVERDRQHVRLPVAA